MLAKKRTLFMLCLALLPVMAQAESPMAIGVEAGTTGYGLQLHSQLSDRVNLRLGYSHLSASENVKAEDNNGVPDDELRYRGKLKFDNLGLLADFYPWAGNFRISTGAVLNDNDLKVTARCENPSGCEIGNSSFSRSEIGTITTKIDVRSYGPYLGMGWGNPLNAGTGLRWSFELGVIYLGDPEVQIRSDGSCGGLLSFCQTDFDEEEKELEEDLDNFKFYPVVTIGLVYRFR